MSTPWDIALWLARHGLYVFPLRPFSKRPWGNCARCKRDECDPQHCPCLTADKPCHGLLASTVDLGQIRRWGRYAPRANVAVDADRSGLVVLDLDCKDKPSAPAAPDVPTHVATGLGALHALIAAEGVPWPDTLTVATPTDGRHLYFQRPEGLHVTSDARGRVGHQIDIRAEGGYVVAPGCEITAPPEDTSGGYMRVSATVDIAPLPEWLHRRVSPPRPPAGPVKAPNLSAVRQGNHTPAYWDGIWDGELSKVETEDGERWKLVYNAARRLANLATHDAAPWCETEAIDALVDAAINRRQRTGKPTEPAMARRNATRGWQRGTQDGPNSLLGRRPAA